MDAWQPIDDLIVQRRIIAGMQAIRQAEGCSLEQAISLFVERYELLRQRRPDDFEVSHDGYWHGVYT
ncbi:hypothetical protein AB0J86_16990 [Micromonospora sp. NPDC049559]|uniref:hypothetical protein n=1 Tax=Micromonospora sp. NPDC049559 TaxID=3155923 RepID=UPI003428BC88